MSISDSHKATITSWLDKNPLEMGTLKEFRKGQIDFKSWGNGVMVGPKDSIINKLCLKITEINGDSLSIKIPDDYSWQQSKLKNFCARVQTSLPNGTLAGYYLGRIEEEKYALFGYSINNNEGWSEDHLVDKVKYDSEEDKPLNLDQLFCYGFNKIVVNSSTQKEIISLLSNGDTSSWLNAYGNPIGEGFLKLSYKNYGIAFYMNNSILKEIEVNQSWKGKTEGGFQLGSSASEIKKLMDRLKVDRYGFTVFPQNEKEAVAISFSRTTTTPRGKEIHNFMAFYFEKPISVYQDPFIETPITKIQVEYGGGG